MTAAGSPSHDGSCGVAWLGLFLGKPHDQQFWDIPSHHAKSQVRENADTQMPAQVLYLLTMEVVTPCDTRTMWMYSVNIGQRLMHRTGQLTT